MYPATADCSAAKPTPATHVYSEVMKQHLRIGNFVFALAVCLPAGYAQTALTFEVASVKPHTAIDRNMSLNHTPGGGLECVNVTLRTLVTYAFDLRDYQLAGGPSWLDTEHFDIVAKAPADAKSPHSYDASEPANIEIRQRTQALLADRFKLVVHHETREMPAYALVLDKGGPKLTPWKESDGPGPSMHGEYPKLSCRKYTMQLFASGILSDRLGRPVMDKTGVTGEFTFVMTFIPDPSSAKAASADAPEGPTFVEALREQLGLRLESQRGPADILVIDHAEKASAN
jgi:bla regulator protein blaR1